MLIVSDDFAKLDPLQRFHLATLYLHKRVQVFAYTYHELEKMTHRGNPLALTALIEGKPLKTSERIERLSTYAKKCYKRENRTWIHICADR